MTPGTCVSPPHFRKLPRALPPPFFVTSPSTKNRRPGETKESGEEKENRESFVVRCGPRTAANLPGESARSPTLSTSWNRSSINGVRTRVLGRIEYLDHINGPQTKTMSVSKPKQYALAILASIHQGASAFTSPSTTSSLTSRPGLSVPSTGASSHAPPSTTSLASTVDPATITKKEYQDICGVDFDDSTLADRLARTNYLYPKHVEVIEDFAPLVDKMVDEIVSICTKKSKEIWRLSGSQGMKAVTHGGRQQRNSIASFGPAQSHKQPGS